jgi:DUF1680 family protein
MTGSMQAKGSDGGQDRPAGVLDALVATPGPAAPTSLSHARLRPLDYRATALHRDGLLGVWQELNRGATIDHCIARLESSGNLENLRRVGDPGAGDYHGFWFADSDIYKVLEAVGWETGRAGDVGWSAFVDDTVALLRATQEEDGYLNSWIQGMHPDQRWQDLRQSHELYCAGHLIQAAVAVARGAGRNDLLDVARGFADLCVERFGEEGGEPGVDGHPEIETALVELYRHTNEARYLALASSMVERRGRGLLGHHHFGSQYLQDHAPVREATEPVGHAVRQLYLAAGVTDVYLETGDASLLEAMEQLWQRTFTEKTYVTGAHGSRHRDEAFGDPFELPPDRAYGETCAAIASFMWNWRLLLATADGRYAEEMERALYNAIAVSTSLDGCHFSYSNPLHLRDGHDGSSEDAPSERLPWFKCACCPPNLARLIASLHHYVATRDDHGLQVQLLAPCRIESETPEGGAVALTLSTDYPWDGRVDIAVESPASEWTLSLRIPAWCDGATVAIDGDRVEARADEQGYLHLRRAWSGPSLIELELPMPVRVLRPHPRVDAVRGCVALARGPIVYCVEQADHPDEVAIEDLRLDPSAPPVPAGPNPDLGVAVTLVGSATVRAGAPQELYPTQDAPAVAPAAPATLTAIPYFRWANRGPNAMRVWIPTE